MISWRACSAATRTTSRAVPGLASDVNMQRSNGDHAAVSSEAAVENLAVAPESADMEAVDAEAADMEAVDAEAVDAEAVVRIRRTSWKSRLGQLDQIVPALLFLLFYNLGNTVLAVAAATVMVAQGCLQPTPPRSAGWCLVALFDGIFGVACGREHRS